MDDDIKKWARNIIVAIIGIFALIYLLNAFSNK